MNEILCSLCREPLKEKRGLLCERCLEMEERLNYIIENNRDTAGEYLGSKLNAITDPKAINYDRRQTPYQPPRGTHTPDRRINIRRLRQQSKSPKRRKSDFHVSHK